MERVFKGRGLSLQAALVMDERMGAEIDPGKARHFHQDDKGTLLVTSVYYARPDVTATMLENGAALAFRDFEACRIACKRMKDRPACVKTREVMGLVAHWAEKQGVDIGAIRQSMLNDEGNVIRVQTPGKQVLH